MSGNLFNVKEASENLISLMKTEFDLSDDETDIIINGLWGALDIVYKNRYKEKRSYIVRFMRSQMRAFRPDNYDD